MTDAVAQFLGQYKYSTVSEKALQDGVAAVLEASEWAWVAEHRLDKHDRIDFYLPALRVGIELKIGGGVNVVSDQLLRYALHDEISELVLVTSKSAHRRIPDVLNSKPIAKVYTYRGVL